MDELAAVRVAVLATHTRLYLFHEEADLRTAEHNSRCCEHGGAKTC